MKQTAISGVVAALLGAGLLVGCGGGVDSSTSGTKLLAQTGCVGSSCYGYNVPSSTSLQFYVNSAPWADLHYTVNGGGQVNVRMAVSGTNNTYTVSGLSTGAVVRYFFTIGNSAGGATDTAWMSVTVGAATPTPAPTPTPTPAPTGNVTLYNDCNYGGWAASFGVGSYKLADMQARGAANDQASSIRIPAGYKVTLYKDDNFTNTAVTLTGDNSCFVGINFNDVASSMVVSTSTTPTPTPTPAPTPTPTPAPTPGPWNGNTTFTVVNNTHAAYSDSQVYWAIIGKDWNTGKFVWVNASGQLVPMSTADNGALTKGGQTYTNYFHTIAQARTVTIPPINSARMMLSVGGPMYIKVLLDGAGNVGYAGANIENPSDPNIDVYFDFIEMAILRPGDANQGIFANTTRVDQFGFPVLMRVQGGGGFDQTVGETETRSALISSYLSSVPAPFQSLAQAPYSPYRIVAPAHGTFGSGKTNGTYLDSYINALWSKYTSQNLTFTDQQGTFTGHVVGNQFQFSDGQGTYIVNKPTTPMALLGNGTLNDPTGTTPGTPAYDKQLQTQAQMCAAINRHIVEDPAHWYNQAYHYLTAPGNYFAKFWHDHGVNKLAYGFAYDDVGNLSPSIHTASPTTVTVTVGW